MNQYLHNIQGVEKTFSRKMFLKVSNWPMETNIYQTEICSVLKKFLEILAHNEKQGDTLPFDG